MKQLFPRALAGTLATLAACAAFALEPAQNIDPAHHGNLAAAQDLIRQAYDRVGPAQAANDSHLGGHAARAKELLRQANEELRLAAITANYN